MWNNDISEQTNPFTFDAVEFLLLPTEKEPEEAQPRNFKEV
jgi:hypothetical protein